MFGLGFISIISRRINLTILNINRMKAEQSRPFIIIVFTIFTLFLCRMAIQKIQVSRLAFL